MTPDKKFYVFVLGALLIVLGCKHPVAPTDHDSRQPLAPNPAASGLLSELSLPLPLPDVGGSTSSAPTAEEGTSDAAVIVAIEEYAHMQPITGAILNADAWKRYLTHHRGVSHIEYLTNSNATDHMIRNALSNMRRHVSASGRLWFVFIGHGVPGKPGRGGLMVGYDAEADIERIAARSISQEEVVQVLSSTKGHGVAIIDACFSGRGSEGEPLISGIQLPNFEPPKSIKKSHRMVAITAATGTQFAGPLPGTARPAFSYLFLGALRGWGDQDHNGTVTAEEATAYVRQILFSLNREQTPTIQGKGLLPLSRGVEPGPSTEIFRPTRLNTAQEFNANNLSRSCSEPHFGADWPPLSLPTFLESWNSGRPTSTSIQSDAAYIQARAAQSEGQRNPGLAQQSWCSLAQIVGSNPYVSVAKTMCERWKNFNAGILWLDQDLACLSVLLDSSSHLNPQQQQMRINEFALRYGELIWTPAIQRLHTRMPLPMRTVPIQVTPGSTIYVDRELVSVEAYNRCVDRGACARMVWDANCVPYDVRHSEPATCVSGIQAISYCKWLGKELASREVAEQAVRGRRMQEDSTCSP